MILSELNKVENMNWTEGYAECHLPKVANQIKYKFGAQKTLGKDRFPCIAQRKCPKQICHFVTSGKTDKIKQSGLKSRNKFILMRGLLHCMVQQLRNCSDPFNANRAKVEEVSKIASAIWRTNKGVFQSYHEMLAVFEDSKSTNITISKSTLKKLTEAIGRECIPSTYSYETLTNGADTTAMESKKTYKAFCGRFSLKEATGRVRKKKPTQTFALRSAKIEDIFLI